MTAEVHAYRVPPSAPGHSPDIRLVAQAEVQSALPLAEGSGSTAATGAIPSIQGWTQRYLQSVVEVVAGVRAPGQLDRLTAPTVLTDLKRRAHLVAISAARRPSTQRPRPHVRSVHTSQVSADAVEVCARVSMGGHHRAIAGRLERRHGRWQCCALEFC